MLNATKIIKEYVTPKSIAVFSKEKQQLIIGYSQIHGVYNGLVWDKEQQEADFRHQLVNIARILDHNFIGLLTNHQRSALISLIHDIGMEEFLRSDIPSWIVKRNYILVSNHFMYYNKCGRVVSIKKVERRRKEQELFNSLPILKASIERMREMV